MESLEEKTLVMIVGPSAIGKSTLMNEVVRQHTDFGRTTGFTTRDPRPNDEPGQYRYLTKNEVEEKIIEKSFVQYAVFPTTGQMYGTEVVDYPNKYNLKDILSNAVADFRSLPFKRSVTVSLTASASEWQKRFLARYPKPTDDAKQRLQEAKLSIEWSLRDKNTYWLNNAHDHIADTATQLVDIVTSNVKPGSPPSEPHAMLELIERGIWHKK